MSEPGGDVADPPLSTPDEVAAAAAALAPPLLLACDIDGTLAPIVEHADLAALAPRAADALDALEAAGVIVVMVSGRGVGDVQTRFEALAARHIVGSHGAEDSRGAGAPLAATEQRALARLAELAEHAASAAPGAWVEHKPVGVALHARQAEPAAGTVALEAYEREAAGVEGVSSRRGHAVVEVSVRDATKAGAVLALRARYGAASVLALGDDRTDEDIFRVLGDADVSVKVGPGRTAARYRLADPPAVVDALARLATLIPSAR
jgi:trehalose 6-phosphate phosphatase